MRKNKELQMTQQDINNFENATNCYLCNTSFKKRCDKCVRSKGKTTLCADCKALKSHKKQCQISGCETCVRAKIQADNTQYKVRDHDHETGKYRGARNDL